MSGRQISAERCNRCRFWREDMAGRDPNDPDWGFGWRRRRPPVLIDAAVRSLMPPLRYGQHEDLDFDPVELTSATLFPATTATDWCGDFGATPMARAG